MTPVANLPQQVLYLNHTGQVSGAERSLLELIEALPDSVRALLACPEGELARAARRAGIEVKPVPEITSSLGLHPARVPHALRELASATLAVRRIGRRHDVDLVHANSIRAGIVARLASGLGGPPALVHVRDVLPPGALSSLSLRSIRRTTVIANSQYTSARLHSVGINATVVYSPVDLTRFDPRRHDGEAARRGLGLGPETSVLAVVGQITPWKGQLEAIQVLSELPNRDTRLLIVGSAKFLDSARYDNRGYERSLRELAQALGLEERVLFLGEREDVAELLGAVDVLLVPSWEEPFGRVVVEGMAMGVPIVATAVGGPAELIHDGVDGLLRRPRDPAGWARAIDELQRDPARRAALSDAARERVATFDVSAHAAAVMALYSDLLPARMTRAG